MEKVEQGALLRVSGLTHLMVVVSNNLFNQSGKVIACPLLKNAEEGPLHIPLKGYPMEGCVLCEQVRFVDLSVRQFSILTTVRYYDIMDISDAVMGMFDYQSI